MSSLEAADGQDASTWTAAGSLESADRLLYEKGVHEVGLQAVIDDCGCGKNALYREFPIKDDLVGAYLERRREQWRALVDETIAPLAGDPAQQIIAIVKIVADQSAHPSTAAVPSSRLTPSTRTAATPGRSVPTAHHQELSDQLYALARRARLRRPRVVSDRIMLIVEGLYATGAVLGDALARSALEFAQDVVRAAAPAARSHERPVVPRVS